MKRLCAILNLNRLLLHEFLNIYEQLSNSNKTSGHSQFVLKAIRIDCENLLGIRYINKFFGEF